MSSSVKLTTEESVVERWLGCYYFHLIQPVSCGDFQLAAVCFIAVELVHTTDFLHVRYSNPSLIKYEVISTLATIPTHPPHQKKGAIQKQKTRRPAQMLTSDCSPTVSVSIESLYQELCQKQVGNEKERTPLFSILS